MERQLLDPFRFIDVDWYKSADSFRFRIQNRSGRITDWQAEGPVDPQDRLSTLRELGGGSDDAGGIKILAEILFGINKTMNYL